MNRSELVRQVAGATGLGGAEAEAAVKAALAAQPADRRADRGAGVALGGLPRRQGAEGRGERGAR